MRAILHTFVWISLGAIAGANLRHLIAQYAVKWAGPNYPWGTLAINVTGSFVLGFFGAWAMDRPAIDHRWRLIVAVGFCGGYTTFSSYAWETLSLAHRGELLAAIGNVAASNVLSLVGVALGAMVARSL
jgi:fluoride exporter